MHKIAELSKKIRELSGEVDQYFIDKGFDIEELRCGNGRSLEELDYGNDITDEFCQDAASDFSNTDMWDIKVMRVR